MHFEQIRPELTWRLRREVLYPAKPLAAMQMPVDADGLHFGAFSNNLLVGVISLFENGTTYQFRKFAVATNHQGQGIGTGLLNYVISFCQQQKGTLLWCNARTTATQFYEKVGFTVSGQSFEQNNIAYIKMEKPLIKKAGSILQTGLENY
ncbi:GNAT family N-acetyltransferase [Mucilaginibacter sp. CSA2-8R]|uniref:GNAT family N-acetyltransferase n=1 Tax=Mucilaginibacter sp. CSA2-8R TaxID=3141542 RepID=UPI00315D376B